MAFAVRRAREHLARLALLAVVVALVVGGIGGIDAASDRMLAAGASQMLATAEPGAQTVRVQALQADDAAAQDAEVRGAVDTAFASVAVEVSRQASVTMTARTAAGAPLTLRMLDDGRIPQLAVLAKGEWPRGPGEIALPVAAVDRAALRIGDSITLAADGSSVTLVGTWRADDAADPAWQGDPSVASGESEGAIGPALVAEGALDRAPDTPTITWAIAPVDPDLADVPTLQHAVSALRTLPDALDPQRRHSTRVLGELGDTLQRQATALAATRGLLVAPLLIIALLGALVLGIVLSTLSTARQDELALMRARGASRRALGLAMGLEAACFAAVGAAAALALLGWLWTIGPAAWLAAAGSAVFAAAAAGVLTARSASRADAVGADSLRSDAGPRMLPTLLLPAGIASALAALATWQLIGTRTVVRADGTADPLASSAPALLLVAGCTLAPVIGAVLAALLDRMLRATRGVAPSLPLRQIARRIGGVAVAILCLALAAASVALSVAAPAVADGAEQRARSALLGADVRMISSGALDVTAETASRIEGVTDADEVLRVPVAVGSETAVIVAGAAGAIGLGTPLPDASGSTIPAALTRSFAARLGAEAGTVVTARIRGSARPVQLEVARIVDALPAVGDGYGVAVDPRPLRAAGVDLPPNELRVRTGMPEEVAAQLRAHATHPVRILTAAEVSAAPVTSTASALLAGGALIAAVLGVVGFLAASSASNRTRRGETLVLRALGLHPARARALRVGESAGVAVYALAAGAAVGAGAAALVLPIMLGMRV